MNVVDQRDSGDGAPSQLVRGSARMCVGCRQHGERDDLVRVVWAPTMGGYVADASRRLPGRGASVHPSRRCLSLAVRRGSLSRALATESAADLDALVSQFRMQIERSIEGLVVAAWRSGGLSIGTDATREALAAWKLSALIVATDASGRRDDLVASANAAGRRVVMLGTKSSLGRWFGREEVGVLGVTDARIARAVMNAAERLAALSEEA